MTHKETIVAQATAPGRGSVGIIRISGPLATIAAQEVLKKELKPRMAHFLPFYDEKGNTLDQGIALFFKAPNSFTGEDVLELQGHGGQVMLDLLLKRILTIKGIRLAKAGEFSEQAFLNDKMDLAQAEAIADLIDATSEQAAKSAMRSLSGEFSKKIYQLVDEIIYLRTYVEAAIDFPDEEIDFLADGKILAKLEEILTACIKVKESAKQGSILREGMKVVIAGKPNAGKSSLLNALAGRESAIVTSIAGTTRDVLREHINLDGIPLHIIDTAGLREASDEVEQIGIKRAYDEIEQADHLLLMIDLNDFNAENFAEDYTNFFAKLPQKLPVTMLCNKIDTLDESKVKSIISNINTDAIKQQVTLIPISAQHKTGLNELKEHLKKSIGYRQSSEGTFIARARHLTALDNALEHLEQGKIQLVDFMAGELLAEELRLAQQYLSEITGVFTSDDLLSNIFSSFCIGK